jgi:hypothetical protein
VSSIRRPPLRLRTSYVSTLRVTSAHLPQYQPPKDGRTGKNRPNDKIPLVNVYSARQRVEHLFVVAFPLV